MAQLTIKDIAQRCGVGKSTVSRVINNDPNVSEKTRQKVQSVIDEWGFQPSKNARAMRGVEHRSIGIIVTRLKSNAENQVLSSILPLLYEKQCEPLIVESQFSPKAVEDHLRYFQQRKVDGIILFAFSELAEEQLAEWADRLVVIAKEYRSVSSIRYDDEQAVQALMAQLYQQNHRHISYLGLTREDETTGLARYQAYLDFCHSHQLIPHALLGERSYQWAFEQVHAVISAQTSAIVCATDNLALGVMKYLLQNDLSHIQVSCVGHTPLLGFLYPQISDISLPFEQVGQLAVQQLFALLDHQPIQHFRIAFQF